MTSFIRNQAYEQRIHELILEALMTGLKDPETNVAVWRTGEIVNVFEMMTAMLLAGSPVVDTHMKLREFTDEAAKRMRRRVKMFQEKFAKDGAPFPQYVVEGDMH